MESQPDSLERSSSNLSQTSQQSQTAQDFIASQLSLEADAREALPYQFDTCTKPLGSLRQSIYACLTCTRPPTSPHQQFTPAGVCYSCSISCHGEHNLVELFTKRDFVCDCGTMRLANSGTLCTLRADDSTGVKGVKGEAARMGNKYNQNFEGKFCGCGEEYDPEKEKGTMFQCLGLGHLADGGCGEDWWHPECLLGLPRAKHETKVNGTPNGNLETVTEEAEDGAAQPATNGMTADQSHIDDPPLPPGFPDEDDFDHMICYKCVNAFPWIKAYANSSGFLKAKTTTQTNHFVDSSPEGAAPSTATLKRKAEDDAEESFSPKRAKSKSPPTADGAEPDARVATEAPQTLLSTQPKHALLPPAPASDHITLFLKEDFRDYFCRCPDCFPSLAKHDQLLEEEEAYEPPLSETDDGEDQGVDALGNPRAPGSAGARSVNSGSLLDRGEAALSSMDRVKAIEGVMAYNHMKDKVKAFLQPFAESGQAVGAEDVKAYFAKLRGDEMKEREAMIKAEQGGRGGYRKGQEGY